MAKVNLTETERSILQASSRLFAVRLQQGKVKNDNWKKEADATIKLAIWMSGRIDHLVESGEEPNIDD